MFQNLRDPLRDPRSCALLMGGTMIVALLVMVPQELHRQKSQDRVFNDAKPGASPVVAQAIEQVHACVLHARGTSVDRDGMQTLVWVPCVQQGDGVLRDAHAEDQLAGFHARLMPAHDLLMRDGF